MTATTHRHRHTGIGLALVVVLALFALPAAAAAATTIYYTHEAETGEGNGVFAFPLGGTITSSLFAEAAETAPEGIALDPANGKVYWTDPATGEIRVGGLGGEGEGPARTLYKTKSPARDIAVDAATGKLYWTEPANGEISVGGLGGEEAQGSAQTLYEKEATPVGIALDAATGKLYWTDGESDEIRVGAVTGESEAPAQELLKAAEEVGGLAIDSAAGKVYWTNNEFGSEPGRVWAANLNGSEAHTLYQEAPNGEAVPYGIAVDPVDGRLYWDDYASGLIRSGGPGGEAAGETPETVAEAAAEGPNLIALLGSPVNTAPPTISHPPVAAPVPGGGASITVNVPLSCSEGTWAADVTAESYYQAPRSFAYQWTRDGAPISGATAATFTPSEGGSYVCDVTASNAAGSTAQGSAVAVVPAPAPTAAISAPASGGTHTAVPKPVSVSVVKIVSGKAIVKGGHARVRLACKGDARCAGKLVLKARMPLTVKHGHHHRSRMVTIVLGRASFAIRAKAHATVSVKLSSFAKKALASARHHRVKAKAIAKLKGGRNAHRTVKLSEKSARRANRGSNHGRHKRLHAHHASRRRKGKG